MRAVVRIDLLKLANGPPHLVGTDEGVIIIISSSFFNRWDWPIPSRWMGMG